MAKKEQCVKFKKAPGAPRRFKSAYMFFSTEKHKTIRQEKAEKLQTTAVAKMVSQAWKQLPPEEREGWEEMATRDKARYEMEKTMYTGPWKVPASKKSSQKDPNAPKRPMSAFLSYSNSKRGAARAKNPGIGNAEVSRILAQMWKGAPEEERKLHIDKEFGLRQQYKSAIAIWRQNMDEELKAARKKREDFVLQRLDSPEEVSITRVPLALTSQQETPVDPPTHPQEPDATDADRAKSPEDGMPGNDVTRDNDRVYSTTGSLGGMGYNGGMTGYSGGMMGYNGVTMGYNGANLMEAPSLALRHAGYGASYHGMGPTVSTAAGDGSTADQSTAAATGEMETPMTHGMMTPYHETYPQQYGMTQAGFRPGYDSNNMATMGYYNSFYPPPSLNVPPTAGGAGATAPAAPAAPDPNSGSVGRAAASGWGGQFYGATGSSPHNNTNAANTGPPGYSSYGGY